LLDSGDNGPNPPSIVGITPIITVPQQSLGYLCHGAVALTHQMGQHQHLTHDSADDLSPSSVQSRLFKERVLTFSYLQILKKWRYVFKPKQITLH